MITANASGCASAVCKNRNSSRIAVHVAAVLGAACMFGNNPALAQNMRSVHNFALKQQTLDKALLEFGRQAHVQIMFAFASSMGQMHTEGLKGEFTGKQALEDLLKGTPLKSIDLGHTVEIIPNGSREKLSHGRYTDPESAGTRRRSPYTNDSDSQSERSPHNHRQKASKTIARKTLLKEVIVTGSRLPTTVGSDPQEVQIYNRAQINQSGQNSVADFLSTLPSVSVTSPPVQNGFVTTVQLRGLPVGSTLVLLNGRRLENSGLAAGSFFDLNNIPLAAVQKIELEENGASAVYGSDALAGVVNIILKRNFDGLAGGVRYGWAKDQHVIRANFAFGKQWHRAGFSLIASYDRDSGLVASNRLLSSSNDYSRFGGPNNDYPICSRGNVFSVTGKPLPGGPPGGGATYAAVTGSTASGRPPFSQFTYGALNECSIASARSILPQIRRASVYIEGHVKIAPAVHLFTELLFSQINQIISVSKNLLFGVPGFQSFTVSAANPYNPFGRTVGVTEALPEAEVTDRYYTDFFRPLIGIKGTIGHHWTWELDTWQSTDWTQVLLLNALENPIAIQNALNSANPSLALNPFVNGPIGSRSLVGSLFSSGSEKMMGRERSSQAYIRGTVIQLPAGAVDVVVGVDYDRSTLYDNYINNGIDAPNTRLTYHRKHYAIFSEAKLPLIRGSSHVLHGSLLAMTLAGRHDQYSDFGGATTEQLGLVLKPIAGLIMRGTWSNAFQAPTLQELYEPQVSSQEVITDPATNSTSNVVVLAGGNPGLKPIGGESQTIGVTYNSRTITGLSATVTQWRTTERNMIESVFPQVIVNNPNQFPGRVIRGPSGDILKIIDTAVNFGSIDVAGIDYQIVYHRRVMSGHLSINADASETYHYLQEMTATTRAVEVASKAQDSGNWAPRWKGMLIVGWRQGPIQVHLDGRYIGSYQDYDSTRQIGNFWRIDGNIRWIFRRHGVDKRYWPQKTSVTVGGTNLFNSAPQFSNYGFAFLGYDAAQTSILGRQLYIDVSAKF